MARTSFPIFRVTAGVCGLLLLSVLTCRHTEVSAATISHQEQVVREAYASVSLLCEIPPVTKAAFKQLDHEAVNTNQLSSDIQQAVPTFALSNFTTGSIASISNQKWSDFVTFPAGQVLKLQGKTKSYSDNGNQVQWHEMSVAWGTDAQVEEARNSPLLNSTIGELLAQTKGQSGMPASIDSYAAYTVDVYYRDKSTGNYRSIFLFGKDLSGKEIVFARDLMVETPLNEALQHKDLYPAGILKSRLRDTPAVEGWIQANRRPAASCSSNSELCCADDKCGIRDEMASRDLAVPLPEPKQPKQ